MKKVFVNGYGSIGSRISKFISEDSEIDVIGVGKIAKMSRSCPISDAD